MKCGDTEDEILSRKNDVKDYLGKRLLIRQGYSPIVNEVTIIEISPSGKWLKFRFSNRETWEDGSDIEILEVLGPVSDGKVMNNSELVSLLRQAGFTP